ncbi:MAG: FecR domain-containing protein [Bacteroidota bacterium]|nr:FecR domain-containing protein [Bacteroidota bacterium]
MNIETDSWSLIARYLKGALSEVERHELSVWLNANPANKIIFEQVKNLWIAADYEPHIEVDVDDNWRKFQIKVSIGHQPLEVPQREGYQSKQTTLWPKLYRVAAVLVVGLLLAYFISNSFLKDDLVVLKTSEEKQEFVLPDNSIVVLNRHSMLSYASGFDVSNRVVNLEGEAYFDIKKAEGQRFIIYAKNSKTEVLGTSFTINAYHDQPQVEVKVISGKVAFSLLDESNTVFLEPGKKGVLSGESKNVEALEIDDVNFLSWKTHKLVFDGTRFNAVVKTLESHFGKRIIVENPEILNCRYSGIFEDPEMENALEVISATMNLDFKKENNTWIISGPGCN